MAVPNAFRGLALHPFRNTLPGNSIQSKQCVAAKGNAPSCGRANVSAEKAVLDADSGVRDRRQREAPERGPKERSGRNKPPHEVTAGSAHRLTNQHRAATAQPTANEEVEASAVRRSDAGDPVSPHMEIRIPQLPIEDDPAMPWRKLGRRQRDPHRRAGQGTQPGST